MQVTVEIPDQVAAKAAALGVPVEQYVRELLARELVVTQTTSKVWTREESRAWLDDMSRYSDEIPELPDEALTRESMYRDHD